MMIRHPALIITLLLGAASATQPAPAQGLAPFCNGTIMAFGSGFIANPKGDWVYEVALYNQTRAGIIVTLHFAPPPGTLPGSTTSTPVEVPGPRLVAVARQSASVSGFRPLIDPMQLMNYVRITC